MAKRTARRNLIVLIATLATCLCGQSAAQPAQTRVATAILEGRVLRQGTSEGIADIHILLMRLNPDLPQTPVVMEAVQNVAMGLQLEESSSALFVQGYLAGASFRTGVSPELLRPLSPTLVTTDAGGGFTFGDLPPGRYILTTQKEGYFLPRSGGRSESRINRFITIEDGKKPARMDLSLVRGGIITGHVRDPLGKSISNISIVSYELSYPNGKARWTSRSSAKTDDRGEYRLPSLPPGQYFVGVDSPGRTFYPGVTEPESALAVAVDGSEVTGIDFDLRTSTVPGFKISGTAINPLPSVQPNPSTGIVDRSISTFWLVPREPSITETDYSPQVQNAIPAASRPNGEFEIRDVKPGTYDLYPNVQDFSVPGILTSHTEVNVRDTDVTGVSLTVSPGVTLAAEVVTDGISSAPIKLDSLHLNFETLDTTPKNFARSRSDVAFDANGKLAIKGLPEARYQFWLTGLPETAYVADIRQAGKSVYDGGVLLGPQPDPVQILVNPAGSGVAGIVLTADRKPASNASVILIPPAFRRQNSKLFRTAITDADGKFSISGIMPGSYSILALQDRPAGEPWLNSDFLTRYQDRQRPLTLNSGSSSIQLESISN